MNCCQIYVKNNFLTSFLWQTEVFDSWTELVRSTSLSFNILMTRNLNGSAHYTRDLRKVKLKISSWKKYFTVVFFWCFFESVFVLKILFHELDFKAKIHAEVSFNKSCAWSSESIQEVEND